MSAYPSFFSSSTSSWLRPLRYLMTLMEQTEKAELSLSKPSPRRHPKKAELSLSKPSSCQNNQRAELSLFKPCSRTETRKKKLSLSKPCPFQEKKEAKRSRKYHYSSLQDDRARKLPWLSAWPLHLALISSKKSGESRGAKKGHPSNSYTKATTTDTAMPSRPMLVKFSPACVRTIRRLL